MKTNSANNSIEAAIGFAKAGDCASLETWLRAGNNPDQCDKAGWTPLLWAAARGNEPAVRLLLTNPYNPASPGFAHGLSGALPLHMAGHSGNLATLAALLDFDPGRMDTVWDLNGHTALLQAVFYGHIELVRELVRRGADTSITTARGLGPMELARQFQNTAIQSVLAPYDRPATDKASYYRQYLERIAPHVPPEEADEQNLANRLIQCIEDGKKAALDGDVLSVRHTMDIIQDLVENQGADVNRLAGPLSQPALVVTVTGNNGLPSVPAAAELRNRVASYLLEKGADPALHELHPMGAQTIIRAAVFNHQEILEECARYMTAEAYRDAINEIPVVNGLTAMHDTILRATMAGPDRIEGYYRQTRWFVNHGARTDIEDFAGVTQRQIAERAQNPDVRMKLLDIIDQKE